MLADSLLLNSATIFVFLWSRQSKIFSSTFLNFLFFIFLGFFCKNLERLIFPPFVSHNIFFLALHDDSSLFSEKNLDWNVWIISSLNRDGEKNFLNVSSLKILEFGGLNIGGYNSFNNVFGLILLNLMSTMKRCLIVSSCESQSKTLLNFVRLGGFSFF